MTTESTVSSPDSGESFSSLGLSKTMLEAVGDLGYDQPTPVQEQAIPSVLDGHDLLAAAQTGTGKTAAFLLPVMDRLGHAQRHGGPLMLVVTPTRELAQQIEDVATTIAAHTHHRCVTLVGGVGYQPQKDALRRGCDVLVATPGRLVDLIDQGECHLGSVETLVLDEADRMLDMGFLPSVRRIVSHVPSDRQTLLLSATLDDSAIAGIKDLVRDPVRVEIAHKGMAAETIDQYVLPVSLEAKNDLLAKVLKSEGTRRVIVFTRTKHRADACCRRLRKAGVSCAPIHGNRSQNQREHALSEFRDGKIDVLVATDVLARGIDISDVSYVVNFDVPADPEDYIHRIGRTGRAGETGWALTFVTSQDVDDLFAVERLMGRVVPSFRPRRKIDVGTDPVSLDPDRSAEAQGSAAGKKKSHKHGGKNKHRSTDTTAASSASVVAKAKVASSPKDSQPKEAPKKKRAKRQGTRDAEQPRRERRHEQHESASASMPPKKHRRHPGDHGGIR